MFRESFEQVGFSSSAECLGGERKRSLSDQSWNKMLEMSFCNLTMPFRPFPRFALHPMHFKFNLRTESVWEFLSLHFWKTRCEIKIISQFPIRNLVEVGSVPPRKFLNRTGKEFREWIRRLQFYDFGCDSSFLFCNFVAWCGLKHFELWGVSETLSLHKSYWTPQRIAWRKASFCRNLSEWRDDRVQEPPLFTGNVASNVASKV